MAIWDAARCLKWEAVGRGVRCVGRWWPGPEMAVCELAGGMTTAQEIAVADFLRGETGKAYDWAGVIRFLTRVRRTEPLEKRWFCSELAAVAFAVAGVQLLRREADQISPALLYASPLLRPVKLTIAPSTDATETASA